MLMPERASRRTSRMPPAVKPRRPPGFPTSYPLAKTPEVLTAALDAAFPVEERLPRSGRVRFVAGMDASGMVTNTTFLDEREIGDVLTDACSQADGYRFHDCLHLAFALILGWSPVTRALLGAKRRSSPFVDATEDGGRAIAVEEGVAALVFAHQAAESLFLSGGSLWSEDAFTQLSPIVVETAVIMTRPFEVADRTPQQWAAAIVTGLRAMAAADATGGDLELDFDVALNEWTVLPAVAAAKK
jgi:MazG C-terminal domain